jgi:hypothetical protein
MLDVRYLSKCLPLVLAGALGCSGAVSRDGNQDDPSGGTGGGQGGNGGEGGADVVKPSGKLDRIPDEPLTCGDAGSLNVTKSAFSRLTNAQYVRTLRDLAAPIEQDANLGLELPAETADKKGYLNNYEQQGVQAQFIEQYELTSRAVAKKLVANLAKTGVSACSNVNNAAAETACAAAFIETFGLRAYRRPVTNEEKQSLKGLYDASFKTWGFADALTVVASSMLSAPQLLYRIELGSDDGKELKLNGYEVASRLSYLLWGTTPELATLDAAKAGKLDTPDGITAEANRLLASPKASEGLAEFASQWLRFGKLSADSSALKKDKTRFPDYTDAAAKASFAGLQTYVKETLFADGGGIRKLMSSTKAWVNSASAPLYGLKATGDALTQVDLDPKQRRGLLTQTALLAGFGHETVQAPVQRGVFVLEHLLCSPPPPPPPNVSGAPPAAATDVETTRQKFVRAHEGQVACKNCHKRLDDVGFAFENYDSLGKWQTTETVGDAKKVLPVDASGALIDTYDADGKYDNALGMIDALAKSEQVAQCFVNNFFHYALARDSVESDGCALASAADQVIANEGSFKSLLLATVKSNQFRYRAPLTQ